LSATGKSEGFEKEIKKDKIKFKLNINCSNKDKLTEAVITTFF